MRIGVSRIRRCSEPFMKGSLFSKYPIEFVDKDFRYFSAVTVSASVSSLSICSPDDMTATSSRLVRRQREIFNNRSRQRRWMETTVGIDDIDSVSSGSQQQTGGDEQSKRDATSNSTKDDENDNELNMNLRPSEVVVGLDLHIVGQKDAKRAVAIAMRNRWRRKQLPEELRKEVTPRNVLLVGPTGCGKTEVARRMAKITNAPFIKVEATKFTEVGYHGRDVDQIIRDLMDISMQLTRKLWTEKLRNQAKKIAEDRILDLLTGPLIPFTATKSTSNASNANGSIDDFTDNSSTSGSHHSRGGRESFREMLRQGMLDDQDIEVDVPQGGTASDRNPAGAFGGFGGGGGDSSNPSFLAVSDFLVRMSSGQDGKKQSTERKRMSISSARDVIVDIELNKLLENIDLKKEAIHAVEESGIVFIDEIDKICSSRESSGAGRTADASAEGVQRDLLPIVEGTTINTKYGNVNTNYILFIASGAFHAVKPSDLLPELQGRLPIRVELKGLTEDDLYRILTEPVSNLVLQQIELIRTEGVELVFEDDAIREIARMAALLNRTVENIGARRLHTVMERIMEDFSFSAAELEKGSTLTVSKKLVQERLSDVAQKTDLSKYIL
jgi:ATP-dependent HslUV protease ATP-binding subunit HslU